jgi:pimeloyl-ACP methyl ester carboxylesterase
MDQLEALNADDEMFMNRLDLERLGVFGESLGGAASTVTCSVDARCKAGANGDGPVYGDVIERGLDQPFMYLLSETRIFSNPAFYDQARGPFHAVAVADYEHANIGDWPLYPNIESLREVAWLGSMDGLRSVELTRAALLAFFDIYLKGADGTLEDALKDYPEITVTSR